MVGVPSDHRWASVAAAYRSSRRIPARQQLNFLATPSNPDKKRIPFGRLNVQVAFAFRGTFSVFFPGELTERSS
jgi:hypothetical protein